MSGWSLVAGALVVLSVGVTLLVVRCVAHAAQHAVDDLHDQRADLSDVASSKLLTRVEHLVRRRRAATGPQRPRR
jgi:hypothetical protein